MALVAAGVLQGKEIEPTPERNERLEAFMAYVLEKDAAELRATMKRRHDEAASRELSRNEEAAAALRARVHGVSV